MKLICTDAHPGYWRYFRKGRMYQCDDNMVQGWKLSSESFTVHLDPDYTSSPIVARFEEADAWDLHEYEQRCVKASVAW